MSDAKSFGRWSGIRFKKPPTDERKEFMLKRELNTTASATRLGGGRGRGEV